MAGVSHASVARPSPNAQSYSALPLPSKASECVRRMAGEAPALKRKLADNVVLKLKLSMAARPARREPNAA